MAIQIIVGLFCGFMARRKARNGVAWGIAGVLVPVVPVVLIISLDPARQRPAGTENGPAGRGAPRMPPARPKRCCGRYIPDCRGCPYFRRALFRGEDRKQKGYRGHCEYFDRELFEEERDDGPKIVYED